MTFGKHGDEAFAKLLAMPVTGRPGAAGLLEIALKTLDYKRDEDAATRILIAILLRDDLAEALNGHLGSAAVDRAVKAFLGSQP